MNIVAHNLFAMNASRQLGIKSKNKAKSTEKLSSGYRINRSADDAAGLAISEKMRRQIRGLTQGVKNTQDGISLCQVADGALAEIDEMLHRITELSVQSANGTNSDTDRQAIQQEINQILNEIDNISKNTEFNTKKIFDDGNVTGIDNGNGNSFDTKLFLSSLEANGTPIDTTQTIYSFSASTNGLDINGTLINWNSITHSTTGDTLTHIPITAGKYSFNYNGTNISFVIPNGAELLNVVDSLDGVKMNVHASHTTNTMLSHNLSGTTRQGTTYKFGITKNKLTNQSIISIKDSSGKQLGSSINLDRLIDKSNGSNSITLDFTGITPLSLTLEFANPPTVDDIVTYLNNATFQTTDNGLVNTNSNGTGYAYNGTPWYKSWISGVDDNFLLSNGFSKTEDRVDLNLSSIMNGTVAEPFKLSYNGKTYALTADSKKYLDELTANGGVHTGDKIAVNFSDGVGTVTITYQANTNCAKADELIAPPHGPNSTPIMLSVPSKLQREYIADSQLTLQYQNPTYTYSFEKQGIYPPSDGDKNSSQFGQWWIQSGCEAGDGLLLEIDPMNTDVLGIDDLDISTQSGADNALEAVKGALQKVSTNRSKIGAQQNRLEHIVANEENIVENTTAAESAIRDADMAKEMVQFSKDSILEQVGQSMLAQANQSNQGVLSLLQG